MMPRFILIIAALSVSLLAATTAQADAAVTRPFSPNSFWNKPLAADAPLDPGTRLLLTAVRGQSREMTLDLAALVGLRRIDVETREDERVLIARATLRPHAVLANGHAIADGDRVMAVIAVMFEAPSALKRRVASSSSGA